MKTKLALGFFTMSLLVLLWQMCPNHGRSGAVVTRSGGTPLDPAMLAEATRATNAEMRFLKIPWVLDLFEGFQIAQSEERPVFLYTVLGDPLDDC